MNPPSNLSGTEVRDGRSVFSAKFRHTCGCDLLLYQADLQGSGSNSPEMKQSTRCNSNGCIIISSQSCRSQFSKEIGMKARI
jgi:hypothetical protein